MRIIAGEFRGRKLLPPDGQQTRPITDRVKQSLFDILTPNLPGAAVYDCFAGTGSMGIESLSRGASHATFFERDRSALLRLRQNIGTLGIADRSRVISQDIFAWFASADTRPAEAGHAVGVVFLDPPYRHVVDEALRLQSFAAHLAEGHLAPNGIVLFRHDACDHLELPPLVRYDQREYGNMTLEFLRCAEQFSE